MSLSDKQKAFVDEYLVDCNASAAAARAGYSQNSASTLQKNHEVQQEIKRRIQERADALAVTQHRVLQEIARLAFNDPRQAFDSDGTLLPVQQWPEQVAAAVSSIKINELKDADGTIIGEVKEIKFWDKGRQLELAAKHLGMLAEKVELNTSVAILIRAARERIRLDSL